MEPVVLTTSGHIWLLEYGGIRSREPTWAVYSVSGKFLGVVRAEREVKLLDATEESALVVVWDENDAERIELRRIEWN